ncbi:hypothetical protein GJAV_G00253930, partial [Gymnothorax javanicus]
RCVRRAVGLLVVLRRTAVAVLYFLTASSDLHSSRDRVIAGILRLNMETRWVVGVVWLFCSVQTGHLQATVPALIGQDALLPCPCPHSFSGKHYLVWQIGLHSCVDYTIADESKAERDPLYRNRTRLFYPVDRGNCSLLLHNVRVSDEKTYSCLYKNSDQTPTNVTVALQVAAHYSLQCSSDTSRGQHQCRASGGFPMGRVYWLQDGHVVEETQGLLSEVHSQNPLTHLYDITSTLRNSNQSTSLLCVVENPRLQQNLNCSLVLGDVPTADPWVNERLKASLAVLCPLLLLIGLFLTFLFKFWKRCRPKADPVLYKPASSVEDGVTSSAC